LKGRLSSLRAGFVAERRFLRRERSVLLLLVVVPLLYPIIIAALYSSEEARERPALVVDLDGSALSRRVALDLDATQELRVAGRLSSVDDAVAALRRDEVDLVVVVPGDFSRRAKRGEPAQLAVWSGGANLYTWGITYPAVHATVGALNRELAAQAFRARGLPADPAAARSAPFALAERLLFHPSAGYGRFVAVGIFLVVFQQVLVLSIAFSSGLKRELGLPVAPPPFAGARLLGEALAHAPFWLGGAAFGVLGLAPALGWSGSGAAAAYALFLAFGISLLPVALAIASLARDRMGTFQLLMFFSVPVFVASGFTWPASQLPAPVGAVMALFPATPALRALRVLSMKSGSLAAVAPELGWLAVLAAFNTLSAALVIRRAWTRLPGFPWGLRTTPLAWPEPEKRNLP